MTITHSLEGVEQTLRDVVDGFTQDDWEPNVCCSEHDTDTTTLTAIRVRSY